MWILASTVSATSVPQDRQWDGRFGLPPGVDGEVICMATVGSSIYVGGHFTKAGKVAAKNIARWDGTRWHAVGDGVEGWVNAMAVRGATLYVGGNFITRGPVAATNLATWHFRRGWQAVGGGVPFLASDNRYQFVTSLSLAGRFLYVGGKFDLIGRVAATNVALWDGRRWWSLAGGVGTGGLDFTRGRVDAVCAHGRRLYVAGNFEQASGARVTNLVCWTGWGWQSLGDGITGSVSAFALRGNELLVGGAFNALGTLATNLARWNGEAWLPWAAGTVRGEVKWISSRGRDVWVAGTFDQAGNIAATNVARWTPRGWTNLTTGTLGPVATLAWRGSELCVGGMFGAAGNMPAAHIARWNGRQWMPMGKPVGTSFDHALIGEVLAIVPHGDGAYVGGVLHSASGWPAHNLAHWTGTNWASVGGGVPGGRVRTLAMRGSDLYVGGDFAMPHVGATNLARWNGTSWSDVGGGLLYRDANGVLVPAYVLGLAAWGSQLIVAYGSRLNEQIPRFAWAFWDGTTWTQVDTNSSPLVQATFSSFLVTSGTDLYGVNHFIESPTNSLVSLARWRGTEWERVGPPIFDASGSPWWLRGIASLGGNIYLAGLELGAGPSMSPTNLARWNGATWSGVGIPFQGARELLATTASASALYVGGGFARVADRTAQNVACWNGATWSSLGSGLGAGNLGEHVRVMATSGGKVYLGGRFSEAGGQSSHNFAIWHETP